MWKKEETPGDFQATDTARVSQWGTPAAAASPDAAPAPVAQPQAGGAERATIGRSIQVRGDVTGDEDLLVQGRVEGSINLRQHAVTVGSDGEVVASIVGRLVTVEGRVEGNIDGAEQVVLRSSAFVKGDIKAPRLVLENGARFRGLVDMGEEDERALSNGGASRFDLAKGAPKGRIAAEPAASEANGGGKTGESGGQSRNGAGEESKATAQAGGGSSTGGSPAKGRKPTEAESPQIAV